MVKAAAWVWSLPCGCYLSSRRHSAGSSRKWHLLEGTSLPVAAVEEAEAVADWVLLAVVVVAVAEAEEVVLV